MSNADAEAAKDRGNEAIKQHNFAEAINQYTNAIALDSTNATYYSNRSAAYAAQKNWDKALSDAERSIQLDANFVRGHQRKGQALAGQEDWTGALQAYQAALKLDPNNAQIRKLLQDTIQHAQRSTYHDQQMKQVQLLQEIFTDPLALCREYPDLSHYATDPAFVKKVNEIRNDLSKFEQYANDEDIRMFTAVAIKNRQMEKMNPAEREAAARREQELRERMLREEDEERDRKRKAEKERKEREEKEKAAQEANSRSPAQSQALAIKEKANALFTKKDFRGALPLYDEALALDPTNIVYFNNKAACYVELGDLDKAREISEEAIETGRANRADYAHIARALTRIGTTYLKEEKYETAIEYFKRSLLDKRDGATLNLQKKAEKLLEEKKAKEYYSVELSAKAKEEGNAFYKKNNYPEAVKCYTEAVQRQPDNYVNYSNRAVCYIKLMAPAEALKDAEKCIDLNPNFAKGYLRKGQAHALMKENQKALEAYDLGLKQDPNNAEIKQAIQKVMGQINSGMDEESVKRNIARDPELQRILSDPVMRQVLDDMKSDPGSVQHHMANPQIKANIEKLIHAGVISTR